MNFKPYFLLLLSFMVLASGQLSAREVYVYAGVSRVDLEIADVNFDPKLARAGVGVFIWDDVAIELQSDVWNEADDLSGIGISSDISQFQAAYIRLQSRQAESWSAFANLGYAEMTVLSYPTETPESEVAEELSSPIFVIGLHKFVDRFPNLAYSFSYEVMYEDKNINMSALTFDYSYNFGIQNDR